MNAQDLINAYIDDVVSRLPRGMRQDIRRELTSLLLEDFHNRAEPADQEANAQLARELVDAFGHPRDVAARYLPAVNIIDPADTHRFIYVAVAGVMFIWIAGFAEMLNQRAGQDIPSLYLLRDWWLSTGLGAFWWPGLLLMVFAIGYRLNLRWPHMSTWKPPHRKVKDRDRISRTGWSLGVLFWSLGLYILTAPTRILDWMFGGRAAQEAYNALSYAPDFRVTVAPWLFGLLLLQLVLCIPLILKGRWTPWLRYLDFGFSFLTCVILVWMIGDGPIFLVNTTDDFVKFAIVLIVFFTVLDKGLSMEREVRRLYPVA